MVTKPLKGSDRRYRHRCRLLERQIGRFRRQAVFTDAHKLSKSSKAFSGERRPEHFVTWPKLLYVAANRFDSPCKISACDLVFRCEEPPKLRKEKQWASYVKPSSGFTDEAYSLIRTSSSAGSGVATSLSCSTSVGGPYCVITTAFKESHPAACEKGSIAAGVDHEGIATDAYPLREFTYNACDFSGRSLEWHGQSQTAMQFDLCILTDSS